MAEINATKIKYLSDTGLQTLWRKISSTFLRDSEVLDALTTSGEGKIITSADDVFVQKKTLDAAKTELSERIEEIAAAQGTNIDGKTIIKNDEGKLQTSLFLLNDSDNHVLNLVTTDGDANTMVSKWDYSEFYQEAVKDGILKNVSLVVIPDQEGETDDRRPGTYLKFEFNTLDDNLPVPIYVNVTDLIDVYVGEEDGYIYIDKADGKSTISLDTAKLVEHLKGQDIYNVTSLISRVEGVETRMTELETLVGDLQKAWDDLDIAGLQEQITTNKTNLDNLTAYVNTLPSIAITDEEIRDLQ